MNKNMKIGASRTLRTLAAVGLLAWAGISQAAIINTYTSRASWLADVGAVTTIDFESPVVGPGSPVVPSPPGFTDSGVTFNNGSPDGTLFLIESGFYTPTQVLSTQQASGVEILHIDLGGATNAIGVDLGSFIDGSPILFSFNNGDSASTSSVVVPSTTFFGITSSTLFTSLDITLNNLGDNVLVIDNFSFSQPVVNVPLPGTLALAAMGLLGLAGAIRRRA